MCSALEITFSVLTVLSLCFSSLALVWTLGRGDSLLGLFSSGDEKLITSTGVSDTLETSGGGEVGGGEVGGGEVGGGEVGGDGGDVSCSQGEVRGVSLSESALVAVASVSIWF